MNDWTPLRKQPDDVMTQWNYIHRVTREFMDKWGGALFAYAVYLRRETRVTDVAEAIEANRTNLLFERMDWKGAEDELRRGLTPLLRGVYNRAGNAELGRLKLALRLDLNNPYALRWVENYAANRVVQVTGETRLAIRSAMEEAFRSNIPARRTARAIRGLVGLTDQQSKAVMNYWKSLNEDGTLSAQRTNELADQYARKLLYQRAETIAITETTTAANEGVRQSWDEAGARGLIDTLSRKEWIAAVESPRTCQFCLSVDGQQVPLNEPFQTSRGPLNGPSAHPRCRCALGLVTPV